mmetsp:Transcript_30978/g.100972  ORF Transcript_30978/g.100972 Transcript_30978/m.100972 type:complete len:258 (-) Transcript_30978:461-1234(-)
MQTPSVASLSAFASRALAGAASSTTIAAWPAARWRTCVCSGLRASCSGAARGFRCTCWPCSPPPCTTRCRRRRPPSSSSATRCTLRRWWSGERWPAGRAPRRAHGSARALWRRLPTPPPLEMPPRARTCRAGRAEAAWVARAASGWSRPGTAPAAPRCRQRWAQKIHPQCRCLARGTCRCWRRCRTATTACSPASRRSSSCGSRRTAAPATWSCSRAQTLAVRWICTRTTSSPSRATLATTSAPDAASWTSAWAATG